MAAGDPVGVTVSISANSDSVATVPSGETWVLSGTAIESGDNCRVGAYDGSNRTNSCLPVNRAGATFERPMYDDSVDPNVQNFDCSAHTVFLSGREV